MQYLQQILRMRLRGRRMAAPALFRRSICKPDRWPAAVCPGAMAWNARLLCYSVAAPGIVGGLTTGLRGA